MYKQSRRQATFPRVITCCGVEITVPIPHFVKSMTVGVVLARPLRPGWTRR